MEPDGQSFYFSNEGINIYNCECQANLIHIIRHYIFMMAVNDVYKYVAASIPGYPGRLDHTGIMYKQDRDFLYLLFTTALCSILTPTMQVHNTDVTLLKSASS